MDLKDAIQFITHDDFSTKNKKIWVDLGCGSGTFTLALASILDKSSTIFAIDYNSTAINKIPESFHQVNIKKLTLDFVNTHLPLNHIEGVLMANSLHFVKDKETFLERLKVHLNTHAFFLIIEYDTNSSNIWVPYPIDFQSLKALFLKSGYRSIIKLNSRPSVYGNRQMYAALIQA
ncbi:class I SAM-dependent methyltransferase [Emticicia sp. BO119]|uniref:class I SAM-dependent methyltransferase n=1 Tax=Emticicia sp. BO119 TaxID=2757768 RepID=UPI0015F0F284|nr:methyltransferase domain-containing protein [Emticicia sp. BO119]MBA4850088.1 class I SAM-dependent methyltransferase [Emticicia sp. BO119]